VIVAAAPYIADLIDAHAARSTLRKVLKRELRAAYWNR
jgi:hypothetical protein